MLCQMRSTWHHWLLKTRQIQSPNHMHSQLHQRQHPQRVSRLTQLYGHSVGTELKWDSSAIGAKSTFGILPAAVLQKMKTFPRFVDSISAIANICTQLNIRHIAVFHAYVLGFAIRCFFAGQALVSAAFKSQAVKAGDVPDTIFSAI